MQNMPHSDTMSPVKLWHARRIYLTEHIANFAKNLRQYEENLQTLDEEMIRAPYVYRVDRRDFVKKIEDKLNNLLKNWETDKIFSKISNVNSMIGQLKTDNNGTHEDIAKLDRAWGLQALETQVRNEEKRAREVEWALFSTEFRFQELKKEKKCRKNKKRKLGGTQRNLYL